MNKSNNTKIAENILGYTQAPEHFKGDSMITHQDASGGWYSVPEFDKEDSEVLNLIYALGKNFKVNISIEDDEYLVKILNYHQCFIGEGYSLNEAVIKASLELINRGHYDVRKNG